MQSACSMRAAPRHCVTRSPIVIQRRSPAGFRPMAMQAGPGTMEPELKSTIDKVISSNKVVVFMKGTPQFPQCGFSNTVCQIMRSLNIPFEGVNILADERLRSGMKEYSQWPTFPQVYVGGEFVGGADILIQMYQSGELVELMEREMNS